jgi:polyisoprenoid-binding protein YceI
MKVTLGIIAVLIIGAIGFFTFTSINEDTADTMTDDVATTNETMDADTMDETMNDPMSDRKVVDPGTYTVSPESSIVNWAGQKPLIDGYVNSGSIAVTSGDILVGQGLASGSFTIDMNTLSVSNTPTKPGKESALEEHLMSEGWFNVAEYPEATFKITQVTERADSNTTFMYDVTGELTMKGVTDTLTFPALIYQDMDGVVYTSAELEFDRTKWGVTAGSGSFFDNLADNVVDDMVALSFKLVAEKQ